MGPLCYRSFCVIYYNLKGLNNKVYSNFLSVFCSCYKSKFVPYESNNEVLKINFLMKSITSESIIRFTDIERNN